MGKKLLIFITFLLLSGSIAGWYFFARESRYLGTSPLKAVPAESPMFLRVRDLGGFTAKTVKNSSWKSLSSFSKVSELFAGFIFLDSLAEKNKDLEKILLHKEMIFIPGDNTKLFVLRTRSISEKKNLSNLIRSYFQSKNVSAIREEFMDAEIQKYEWNEDQKAKRWLLVFYQGLLIVSDDPDHIRSAIQQMNQSPVTDDPDFLRVKNNETENIDLNIYINHKTFPKYLSGYAADNMWSAILKPDYAKWTEIDVIQKDNQLLVSGFTLPDSSGTSYLDVFRRQKPVAGSLAQFVPSASSYFSVQNLSNPMEYFQDYRNYLEKKGRYGEYRDKLLSISKEISLDLEKYLNESYSGEAASVFLNYNLGQPSDNRFLVLRMKSENTDPLVLAIKKWMTSNKKRFSEAEIAEAINSKIWRMPDEYFGRLLGEQSLAAVPTNYMTVNEGNIIFGVSPGSLKRYLKHLKNNELLIMTPSFVKFSAGLARRSNYFLWSAPGHSLPFFESVISQGYFHDLTMGISGLRKMDNIAWQWGYENGLVYNSASLSFDPLASQDPVPFWSYRLSGKLLKRPVFIADPMNDQECLLVFQDHDNYLVCLDKDGIEKWKVRLEGPVMGEIKMIDFFRKKEYQMLFNTRNAIHLIGNNGGEIKNYPIRLRSPATSEISVIDYDGKKNYRYLIACRDRKIHNLDKYGKLTAGWQPKITESAVELPVKYFRVGSKDYLVYSDRKHTYVVDRQGKERIKIKEEFAHSGNAVFFIKDKNGSPVLVTTDEKGQIRLMSLDGSSKKMSMGTFSGGHLFMPVEVSGAEPTEFLFVDGKTASLYDFSGNQIFTKELNILTDMAPSLKTFGNERVIELFSTTENKAMLVRSDGTEFSFQLPEKYSLQSIGIFDHKSSVGNLLTCSPDNVLYNFQLIIK